MRETRRGVNNKQERTTTFPVLMRFAQRDFFVFPSAYKVILKRSPSLPVLSSSTSIKIFAFHMFRDLDKRRRRRFISSRSFIFFFIFFSFKLISYTTSIHFKFHLQIREGFSCLNAYSVCIRVGVGFFYQFYVFLFALTPSSIIHPDPFGASVVLGAVDFHLAIKQPFAINFPTTSASYGGKRKLLGEQAKKKWN